MGRGPGAKPTPLNRGISLYLSGVVATEQAALLPLSKSVGIGRDRLRDLLRGNVSWTVPELEAMALRFSTEQRPLDVRDLVTAGQAIVRLHRDDLGLAAGAPTTGQARY